MTKPFAQDAVEDLGHTDCEVCNEVRYTEISRVTILDFGIEDGKHFVTVQFEPLVGTSMEGIVTRLKKGDSLTTTAPTDLKEKATK